jgi:hypothetical protein
VGFFSKLKKTTRNIVDPAHIIHKDKKPARQAVDPDPVNPLTGLRASQAAPQDSGAYPQGLGQLPSFQPAPVSADQAIPQGLGSNVFRSTLAPLQQQGYGLAQIDPRLLQSTVRFPGGSTLPPQVQPQQPAALRPRPMFVRRTYL